MEKIIVTFCFDIDGTFCSTITNQEYHKARPFRNMIDTINELYDAGHYIKIFTARGMSVGIDLTEFTEKQLKEWGVKYHELIMKKPSADIYIDDKGFNPLNFLDTYKLWT